MIKGGLKASHPNLGKILCDENGRAGSHDLWLFVHKINELLKRVVFYDHIIIKEKHVICLKASITKVVKSLVISARKAHVFLVFDNPGFREFLF